MSVLPSLHSRHVRSVGLEINHTAHTSPPDASADGDVNSDDNLMLIA